MPSELSAELDAEDSRMRGTPCPTAVVVVLGDAGLPHSTAADLGEAVPALSSAAAVPWERVLREDEANEKSKSSNGEVGISSDKISHGLSRGIGCRSGMCCGEAGKL